MPDLTDRHLQSGLQYEHQPFHDVGLREGGDMTDVGQLRTERPAQVIYWGPLTQDSLNMAPNSSQPSLKRWHLSSHSLNPGWLRDLL